MAKHNEIGKIGENIAKTFLMKHGFSIKNQNYFIKHGEIDIVAEKDNILHFIEVKSTEIKDLKNINNLKIKPEDNMTFWKKKNLKRTIDVYIYQNKIEGRVFIDLLCVYINQETREGRVKFVENIEL